MTLHIVLVFLEALILKRSEFNVERYTCLTLFFLNNFSSQFLFSCVS